MSETKTIKVQDVIKSLEAGKTREQIRVELGLNKTELKNLFMHPKLKGRKTHTSKAASFVLVDEEETTDAAPATTEAAPVEEATVDSVDSEPQPTPVEEPEVIVNEEVASEAPSPAVAEEPAIVPEETPQEDDRPSWNR